MSKESQVEKGSIKLKAKGLIDYLKCKNKGRVETQPRLKSNIL